MFIGTYKRGAILLSLSVLYGDDGIQHRLSDSGAKAVVTDAANRHRIPDGMVEKVLVMGGGAAGGDVDFDAGMERASDSYEMADTLADDPAQLYYSSGTTGKAKGILHAHRYLLAHEEFEFCHDVRDGELFHGSGEWAWAAGHRSAARARGATARWRSCRRARAATTPRSTSASSRSTGWRTCSPRPPRCGR